MVSDTLLSLDSYTIQGIVRKVPSLFNRKETKLNILDPKGNTVLLVEYGSGWAAIETTSGEGLSTITYKAFSGIPTYEIHDGDRKGKVIALIRNPFGLSGIDTKISAPFAIVDMSRNILALCKARNLIGLDNTEIVDKTNTVNIANISGPRSQEQNSTFLQGMEKVMGGSPEGAGMAYILKITKKDVVPTLRLVEFLVVVEWILDTEMRMHNRPV